MDAPIWRSTAVAPTPWRRWGWVSAMLLLKGPEKLSDVLFDLCGFSQVLLLKPCIHCNYSACFCWWNQVTVNPQFLFLYVCFKIIQSFRCPNGFPKPFGPFWAPQVLGEDGLREVRVIGFKGISENEEVTVTRWRMDADGQGTKVYKSSLKQSKAPKMESRNGMKTWNQEKMGIWLDCPWMFFFGEILGDLSGITGMVLKNI